MPIALRLTLPGASNNRVSGCSFMEERDVLLEVLSEVLQLYRRGKDRHSPSTIIGR
jgi:hypothetical protein